MLTGDLEIMRNCERFLEKKYDFKKAFLTNSCTMALEMAALLSEIQPGDEVIVPSYTFVSTANAFALRGANIVFADSNPGDPNMNVAGLRALITPKTKVIVVVHYAGIPCDVEMIRSLADEYGLLIVEDAAQCIDSYYDKKALGSFGDISCFSFHETKNIHCGEGGLIVINNEKFLEKAEIIRNKGTNRAAFLREEVSKYEWVGLGFSSIPSAITAAFLYSQLENIDQIQKQRMKLWKLYYNRLSDLKSHGIVLPVMPENATGNAHLFYLVCNNSQERMELIDTLATKNIQAVFHYQSLHSSPYFRNQHDGRQLPNADKFSECLVRLPLYYSLSEEEAGLVCTEILNFYNRKRTR